MELLLPLLLGVANGLLVGILPSLGTLSGLILIYPILMGLDPLQLITVYIAQLCVSQYFGNLLIMLTGVSGEPSGVFAAREGYALSMRGRFNEGIIGAAVGSWIGSTVGIILFVAAIPILGILLQTVTTIFQASVAVGALILVTYVAQNKKYESILLAGFGYFLGWIGINDSTFESNMTFDNPYLEQGLPMVVVIVAFIAIPNLSKLLNFEFSIPGNKNKKIIIPILLALRKWKVIIQSSLAGFCAGLVPGVSYIMSSQIAVMLNKFNKRHNDYSIVLSAETANNAGTISTLIPLLYLGIPITASEAFIFELMVYSGTDFMTGSFISENYITLLMVLVIVNLIGFTLAVSASRPIANIVSKIHVYFPIIILSTIIGSISVLGYMESALSYYWIVMICLAPIAYWLKDRDLNPLIFAFILQDHIFDNIDRLFLLYS